MKAVNPDQVSEALKGVAAGFFAVLATLKVQFAQNVTLGYSIGEMFERLSVLAGVDETLEALLGDGLKKWTGPGLNMLCRWLGILVGVLLSRVVWAFHCSLRGGDLMVAGIKTLASTLGFLPDGELSTL